MALDKAYFDAINIDVAKKKYYNVNKVEAVLTDIRYQAELLNAENARLRRQLEQLSGTGEAGEVLSSARAIAQQILRDANARAEEIVSQAESRSRQREERAVQFVEAAFEELKARQLAAIDELNGQYQEFLSGFYEDEPAPGEEITIRVAEGAGEDDRDAQLPPDLGDKVGAIAAEMFQIGRNFPKEY